MVRLNRAQQQQRTREALVEAARELFLSRGFGATSLDAVSDAAGFSRGAVYSNFESKTDLGLEVLDQLYGEASAAAAEAAVKTTTSSPVEWLAAVLDALEAPNGNIRLARMEVEVAAACSDEQVRVSFGSRYAAFRAGFSEALLSITNIGRGDAELIALLIVSALLGAGLQRAADPSVSFGDLSDALVRVLQPSLDAARR